MTSEQEYIPPEGSMWPEMKFPDFPLSDTVRALHETIDEEWDFLQHSACQTAAGRALWEHVIHDPAAAVLAGERKLRSLHEKIRKDRLNNAREISGVIIAVRTLWFDSKIEDAINSFNGGESQVILLGAGMDARAYRLRCLKDAHIFEVDLPKLVQMKNSLLQAAFGSPNEQHQLKAVAKSLTRIAADIREDDWFEKLKRSGYVPHRNTVWVLEGILYYLSDLNAMQVLKTIASNCPFTCTIMLADFMNKSSTTLSNSSFHFYSDWPDHLLPSLGFTDVTLSQIGDPDADFGLMHDPLNLFNKLRRLPRSVQNYPDDGKPCCRLYLVKASGSPEKTIT
ncbi:hypothetical protein Sjap_010369 [Stephania japonica]|uniref:S-adenosyl-L-methionine-dependent methyltransferase n=1 Tax=Stephania japonica TaxID=461633 RepID=A0AAP0J8Z3_9MAGN